MQAVAQCIGAPPGPPGGAALADLEAAVDLLAREQAGEAVPRLEALVAGHPAWAVARAYLGSAYLALARVDEACAELERGIDLAPDSFICRVRYADYLARLGFSDRAVTALDAALALPAPDPASRQDAWLMRAACRRHASTIYYRDTQVRVPAPLRRAWRFVSRRGAPGTFSGKRTPDARSRS